MFAMTPFGPYEQLCIQPGTVATPLFAEDTHQTKHQIRHQTEMSKVEELIRPGAETSGTKTIESNVVLY